MRKLLIAGLLAAAAAPLLAQPPAPIAPPSTIAPMMPLAPMAGKVVTRAEADAKVRQHFAKLDANRDGFVTTEEMTAQRGARQANRQARQGQRTGQMAQRDPGAAFNRIDANRDGAISRDEFANAREMRIEKRVARHGAARGAPGAMRMRMHRMGGHGGMGMMGGHLLKMADADRDGRVSIAEATAGAARHFDMMDGNRDGRITPEERRAGRVHMKQMRRQAS